MIPQYIEKCRCRLNFAGVEQYEFLNRWMKRALSIRNHVQKAGKVTKKSPDYFKIVTLFPYP